MLLSKSQIQGSENIFSFSEKLFSGEETSEKIFSGDLLQAGEA
jgi:hypothetical protein